MIETSITDGQVFQHNRKAHYQINVAEGETVRMLAKASSASEYAQIGEDFTSSTWIYTEDLPFVDIKFEIPTGCEVIRVEPGATITTN